MIIRIDIGMYPRMSEIYICDQYFDLTDCISLFYFVVSLFNALNIRIQQTWSCLFEYTLHLTVHARLHVIGWSMMINKQNKVDIQESILGHVSRCDSSLKRTELMISWWYSEYYGIMVLQNFYHYFFIIL